MIEIKTLVIVPAFNEEESIKKVVKEIKENNNKFRLDTTFTIKCLSKMTKTIN